MRSSFGQRAEMARAHRGLTLDRFARELGVSHARVSQLEHGKTKINDSTIYDYIKILALAGQEANELRAEANFSNNRLLFKKKDFADDRLLALYTTYGPILPENLKEEILERILVEIESQGINIKVKSGTIPSPDSARVLERSSLSEQRTRSKPSKGQYKPSLGIHRLVDLCLSTETARVEFAKPEKRIEVDRFLEAISAVDPEFDIDICEIMPSFARDAYAIIVGTAEWNTVVVEEGFYKSCARGNYFHRHILLHEYAHHVLHGELLKTKGECFLEPHSAFQIESDGCSREIPLYEKVFEGKNSRKYVIPNVIELEAEYFGVLLALPWMKIASTAVGNYDFRTESVRLAKRYGTLPNIVEMILRYFSVPSVRHKIAEEIYRRGIKAHPFYNTV